jgi:hypothetical protein
MEKRRARETIWEEKPERKGVFTSGVIARVGERQIALFFTGPQHAGENLAAVLKRRTEGSLPIHMCDGLAQSSAGEFEAILANCLAHGRRYFIDLVENFPAECRYVLETLREVYRHDAKAREEGMSPAMRLEFHQAESGPLMESLKTWLDSQFKDKKVEPNSSLGQAISYMRNRWEELTVFLRVPGAPLDNNLVERGLKKAIIHRKNSLFYKTQNGARVGDLFMSLTHTTELAGGNPFDYLTELLRHAAELKDAPGEWMPWNYRDTLAAGSSS